MAAVATAQWHVYLIQVIMDVLEAKLAGVALVIVQQVQHNSAV